jgi:hypothetical protein
MKNLTSVLSRIVDFLNVARVPFMIGGSFASSSHGLTRSTLDIDIVIAPPDAAAFAQLLNMFDLDLYYVDRETAEHAYRFERMFNVIDIQTGWKVDFIFRKSRQFSLKEFERRQSSTIADVAVFIATAEDTIISKLEWSKQAGGSAKQRRDVSGIVKVCHSSLDYAYLRRWIAELEIGEEWNSACNASGD